MLLVFELDFSGWWEVVVIVIVVILLEEEDGGACAHRYWRWCLEDNVVVI